MDLNDALKRNRKTAGSSDPTSEPPESIGKRIGHRKGRGMPPPKGAGPAPGHVHRAGPQPPGAHAERMAPETTPTPSPADAGPHLGDRGPAVAEVQMLLAATGYYHARIGGNFGPQTDAALRDFQCDHGLPDDGSADAQTLDVLRAAAAAVPAAPAEGGADAPAPAVAPPAGAGAGAAIAYGMSVLGAPYAAINPYRFGEVPWPGGAKTDIHGKVRGPYPAGTQVFDCSGFVVACWKAAGVDLLAHGLGSSATVAANKSWLIPIAAHELQPGDLVVNPGHIVMFIGGGQIIQSTPNGGVKISDAGSYVKDGSVCRRVPV